MVSEQLEQLLVYAGSAGYAVALVLLLLYRQDAAKKFSFVATLLVLAVACFGFAVAVRWMRLDQGPFFTLYEILLSNVLSLGFICSVVFFRSAVSREGATVVVAVLFVLGVWCSLESPTAVPLPASYANNWLWAHVGLGKIFLGLSLVATGVATTLLLSHFGVAKSSKSISHASRERVVWKLMSTAFFFQSLMLITGAVWANDAWGRYWSWDPLETWAFLTWLCLAILLHARLTYKAMSPAVGWCGVIFVFLLAFLTFFGVPFLSIAPHKGIV